MLYVDVKDHIALYPALNFISVSSLKSPYQAVFQLDPIEGS